MRDGLKRHKYIKLTKNRIASMDTKTNMTNIIDDSKQVATPVTLAIAPSSGHGLALMNGLELIRDKCVTLDQGWIMSWYVAKPSHVSHAVPLLSTPLSSSATLPGVSESESSRTKTASLMPHDKQ
jgi:hypothetical protein